MNRGRRESVCACVRACVWGGGLRETQEGTGVKEGGERVCVRACVPACQ